MNDLTRSTKGDERLISVANQTQIPVQMQAAHWSVQCFSDAC